MADTWTDREEQQTLALLARKAKLLNPERRALVNILEERATLLDNTDFIADMLIERASEFRRLLEPFDMPEQTELPINVAVDVSGWTVHDGKEVPVNVRGRVRVEVERRSGIKSEGWAEDFEWERDTDDALLRNADIIAYRLLPMPEWHPWVGGEQPEPDEAFVEVHFRGSVPGYTITEYAENLTWTHDPTDNEADILCYRVVS